MREMTTEEALAYLERWELVREAENAELQRASVATKFHQLASLVESRDLFREDHQRQEEVEVVRERWSRARKALCAR